MAASHLKTTNNTQLNIPDLARRLHVYVDGQVPAPKAFDLEINGDSVVVDSTPIGNGDNTRFFDVSVYRYELDGGLRRHLFDYRTTVLNGVHIPGEDDGGGNDVSVEADLVSGYLNIYAGYFSQGVYQPLGNIVMTIEDWTVGGDGTFENARNAVN